MKTQVHRAAIVISLLALIGPVSGRALPRVEEMKMFFFPSAACFFLPDGGAMLIDIGKGASAQMIGTVRRNMFRNTMGMYTVLSSLGWRPRIDWLVVTSRNNEWDTGLVDVLNAFKVQELYFPFDVRDQSLRSKSLNSSITRMLLQISFSANPVLDLSKEGNIDFAQSVSGVKCYTLLPQPSSSDDDGERSPLCLLLVYNKVRILIAGELSERHQRFLMKNSPDQIKADIFYHPPALLPEFAAAINARWSIPFDAGLRIFSTDGNTIREEKNNE